MIIWWCHYIFSILTRDTSCFNYTIKVTENINQWYEYGENYILSFRWKLLNIHYIYITTVLLIIVPKRKQKLQYFNIKMSVNIKRVKSTKYFFVNYWAEFCLYVGAMFSFFNCSIVYSKPNKLQKKNYAGFLWTPLNHHCVNKRYEIWANINILTSPLEGIIKQSDCVVNKKCL